MSPLITLALSASLAGDHPSKALVLATFVLLSGVVPMLPVFGTSGQQALYLTHRYSAMVLAGVVGLHLLSLLLGRR